MNRSLMAMSALFVASLFLFTQEAFAAQLVQNACIDLQYNTGYRSYDARTNGEVSVVQNFLADGGYLAAGATGYFGIMTIEAVKKFQVAMGIATVGTPGYGSVGPKTRAKIKSMTCGGASVTTRSVVASTAIRTQTISGNTFASNTQTATANSIKTTDISYKGTLTLDVHRSSTAHSPVILYVHSGGWFSGDKTQDDGYSISQDMPSSEGFNVVSINYTLVPQGYYPQPLKDIDCALRWVVSNAATYDFDMSKLFLGGASAGGHLVLLYALNQSSYRDSACPYTVASPS
ncbi:MAG: alpha/beta hydrolase fold domain-containing protein, partial [Minisyncoccota bacterium]